MVDERETVAPAEWEGLSGFFCEPWTHHNAETGERDPDEWPSRYGAWRDIRGGWIDEPPSNIWFVSHHLSGSDYSGGFVCKANYEAFCEDFAEGEDDWYCTVTGGYATYAVVIDIRKAPREVYETLCALEDYPVICDERVSRLEQEAEDAAWNSWARADFRRALEKRFQIELEIDETAGEQLATLFYETCDAAGLYWEPQGDTPEVWIDVERVAKHVGLDDLTDLIVDESEDA